MRKKGLGWLVVGALFACSTGFAMGKSSPKPPLETVSHVDLERYMGLWFEIARLPQWFEKDCAGVTAYYDLRSDGRVSVENRCMKGSLEGREKVANGIARVVDRESGAKLKVSFFRPFWGDYWVLELGENYEYSVVGAPDRNSLWILSRVPTMKESLIQEILARRAADGFDVSRMERTLQ